MATLNEALEQLARAPVGSFITRPGGPRVRLSRGNVEHSVHRYVVDLPGDLKEFEGDSGVRAFDADEEDHWESSADGDTGKRGKLRTDWALTKRDLRTGSTEPAKETKREPPAKSEAPGKPESDEPPKGKPAK